MLLNIICNKKNSSIFSFKQIVKLNIISIVMLLNIICNKQFQIEALSCFTWIFFLFFDFFLKLFLIVMLLNIICNVTNNGKYSFGFHCNPLENQHTFSVWQYSSCGLNQSQDSYFQSQVIMNSTTLTFSVFHQVQSAA